MKRGTGIGRGFFFANGQRLTANGLIGVAAFAAVFLLSAGSAEGQTYWARTYGGGVHDVATSAAQTQDGGFAIAGRTQSFGAGSSDFFVLKTNVKGAVLWQKTIGTTFWDQANSIIATADGGCVVAGSAEPFGVGSNDVWVIKFDATGTIQWQKAYGGAGSDSAYGINQAADGGYFLAGSTTSYGAFAPNLWVLKIDASGNILWQKAYDTNFTDIGRAVCASSDGGCVVAGEFGNGSGNKDVFVMKFDSAGNLTWQKRCSGAANDDVAHSVRQAADGGYIVAGSTLSFGGGNSDAWVLKLDASGNNQWQKTFGGSNEDTARSVRPTADGGFVVAGETRSFGATGFFDAWLLKLTSSGSVSWQKRYGGGGWDSFYSVEQASDGGFFAAGVTDTFGAGGWDFWALRLDANGSIDASCSFINDTTATSPASGATVGNAITIEYVTTAATAVPSPTVTTPAASISTQCAAYPPGEIQNLRFTNATTLEWNSEPAADSYNLRRGFLHELRQGKTGACAQSGIMDSWTTDNPALPAAWAKRYTSGVGSINIRDSIELPNSGFFLAGLQGAQGWAAEIDANGAIVWQRIYDGCKWLQSARRASNGGYLAGGVSNAGSGDDFFVMKLDAVGNIMWEYNYPGPQGENGPVIVATADGGCVVGGTTASFRSYGSTWLLKLSSAGAVEWQKFYDIFYHADVRPAAGGGFLIAGAGDEIGWGQAGVIKTDASGNLLWHHKYKFAVGAGCTAYSVHPASDGGGLLAGSVYGSGYSHGWLLKFDGAGVVEWSAIYDGATEERFFSVRGTADGGYIAAGNRGNDCCQGGDVWLARLDAAGAPLWEKTYGFSEAGGTVEFYDVRETADGGFFYAGSIRAFRADAGGGIGGCSLVAPASSTVTANTVTVTVVSSAGTDTSETAAMSAGIASTGAAEITPQCAAANNRSALTYLLSGVNANGESSLGTDSAGAERAATTPCP